MSYNGMALRDPHKMGTRSNGVGSPEILATSLSTLSVAEREQSTSGSPGLTRTNLNPYAAEFVPNAFKPRDQAVGSRLDRTNSSSSNASDDEYRRFCRSQLPDDLMPEFDLGEFGAQESANFGGSSSSLGTSFLRPYMPDTTGAESAVNEWSSSFPEDLTTDSIAILANEFPGFASESLVELYYANGSDFNLTFDMLTELELQNEGGMVAQATPAPPSSRDFSALVGVENGRGALGEVRAVPEFAAALRKQAVAQLQFERNGGLEFALGAAGRGISQGPGVGGYAREGRASHAERLESFQWHGRDVQVPATWLETGDSVSTMYADMREEARDYARIRNAYFDQARQAYLTGNKALAKELSAKGQWYNEQMKAAHSKAGEAIFHQRNANTFVNNSSWAQAHLIDLHGLHVGEAIPVLKREIAQFRYSVRSTRQRVNVFICVGTGHHTKGSRTPSRVPAAVQRYLLEEEHLQFSEPQAGILRIIIR